MLGRAKWYGIVAVVNAFTDRSRDSWNKQKGVEKAEAKRLYIAALLKVAHLRHYQLKADSK